MGGEVPDYFAPARSIPTDIMVRPGSAQTPSWWSHPGPSTYLENPKGLGDSMSFSIKAMVEE